MEKKASGGIVWSLSAFASTKLLTAVTTVVLARFLVPADYGMVALAAIAVGFAGVAGHVGVSYAFVLRQDLDREAQRSILGVLLLLSAVSACIIAALAAPVSSLLGQPRLAGVLAAFGGMLLIAGPSWFYDAVLQRELEFRRDFAARSAATLVYAVAAISLAISGAGVWSIVIGQLLSDIAHICIAAWLAPYRVRPALDWRTVRDILRESRGFLLQGGTTFLEQNLDYLAVGTARGANPLGAYSLAYRLSEFPTLAVVSPVSRVAFPALARMRHRGEATVPAFLSTLRLVSLAACPAAIALSAAADPLTRVVFGEKWAGMIGPLAVLGIWGAVRSLQLTIGWFLSASDEADAVGKIALASICVVAPAVFVVAALVGTIGVAWVMVGDITATTLAYAWLAQRRAGIPYRTLWVALRPVIAAGAGAWGVGRVIAAAGNGGSGVALAASILGTLASYGAITALLAPDVMRQAWRVGRQALTPRASVAEGG
jgi:lipopolysaccharide exporter